jgi:hypothetical protein
MARATEAEIRAWVSHIAARCMFASEEEAVTKRNTLARDLLKQNFDAGLFTEQTMFDVVGLGKFFPHYSDVLHVFNRITEQRRKDRRSDATNQHFKAIAASLPSLPGERTDEEKAAVRKTLEDYLAERKAIADAQPEAARPKPKAYHLSNQQLLAEYGRIADDDRYTANERAAAQMRFDMINLKAKRDSAAA